jgi:hypothetical protein
MPSTHGHGIEGSPSGCPSGAHESPPPHILAATPVAPAAAVVPHRRRARTFAPLVAALLGAALVVTACGSRSSKAADHPSSGGASSPRASQSPSGAAYAECMREHGVTNFPDPTGSGEFQISKAIVDNPHFQSASTACQSLRPQGNNGSGGVNSRQGLTLAQCMRAHGVPNFPDPGSNGTVQIGPGLDPNSPAFQNAFKLCKAKAGITGAPVQGGGQ